MKWDVCITPESRHRSATLPIAMSSRTPQASSPPGINEAMWRERLRELMPIRLYAIVPGEAAPYPSCLQQQ